MKSITIATDGLIDDINSLTIATRGFIQPEVPVEDVKVVIPEPEYGGSGGKSPTVYLRKKYERLEEPKRDILKDDEEVLEIIIHTILSGIID